jgi:hypothetical protein
MIGRTMPTTRARGGEGIAAVESLVRQVYMLALLVMCSATIESRQHLQLVCCFSFCVRLQCRPYAVRQSCVIC